MQDQTEVAQLYRNQGDRLVCDPVLIYILRYQDAAISISESRGASTDLARGSHEITGGRGS